jgi:AcrR family transcriptional regulator
MRLSKARKACVTAMMKDSIYEAASSLLERHGADGLTMDRVARKAGLATGSLYNYFQDKEDLLQFFSARLVEPYHRAIEDAAGTDRPAPRKLKRVLLAAVEHAVKYKDLRKLLVEADYYSELRKSSGPRHLQILTTIFQQGIKEGSFRPHDPVHTGRMFRGLLRELFDLQLSGASDKEVKRFAGTLLRALLDGVSLQGERDPQSGTKSKHSATSS